MTLFTDPKEINIGDQVFHEYDDKKAFGTCTNLIDGLFEVDFTTKGSTEQKIDRFRDGFWKKEML